MLTKNLKLSDTIEAGDLKADAVSDETKNRRARKELRGRGEIKDNKMCEAERALRKKITGIFEAIGVLLGHSIRNECPMGISLPGTVLYRRVASFF